jgi:nucleoside-diphosphate-sugar epimerase
MTRSRRVLITGGASFIGSHLTDALVARGATVRGDGVRQELLDAGRSAAPERPQRSAKGVEWDRESSATAGGRKR